MTNAEQITNFIKLWETNRANKYSGLSNFPSGTKIIADAVQLFPAILGKEVSSLAVNNSIGNELASTTFSNYLRSDRDAIKSDIMTIANNALSTTGATAKECPSCPSCTEPTKVVGLDKEIAYGIGALVTGLGIGYLAFSKKSKSK